MGESCPPLSELRAVHSQPEKSLVRMVGGTGGNWKRPVNRMYTYNYQVGENYYLPMTSYIESKAEKANNSLPGPLCFSERIAAHPIVGQQKPRYFENSSSAGL